MKANARTLLSRDSVYNHANRVGTGVLTNEEGVNDQGLGAVLSLSMLLSSSLTWNVTLSSWSQVLKQEISSTRFQNIKI